MAKYRLKPGLFTATLAGGLVVRAGEVVEGDLYALYPNFFDLIEPDPTPVAPSAPGQIHQFVAAPSKR